MCLLASECQRCFVCAVLSPALGWGSGLGVACSPRSLSVKWEVHSGAALSTR